MCFSIIMHFDCFSFRQTLCVLIVTSYLLWALCSKMLTSLLSCSLCIAVSELVYFVCFLLWVTPTAGLCDCRRTWHQKSTTIRRSMKTESLAAAQPSRHGKTSRETFEMETTVVYSLTVMQWKGQFLGISLCGQEATFSGCTIANFMPWHVHPCVYTFSCFTLTL